MPATPRQSLNLSKYVLSFFRWPGTKFEEASYWAAKTGGRTQVFAELDMSVGGVLGGKGGIGRPQSKDWSSGSP